MTATQILTEADTAGGPTAPRHGRELLRRALRDRALVISAGFVLLELLLVVLAPLIAPYSPTQSSLANRLLAPGMHHLMGTDANGTDILSRVLYAPRIDLVIAVAATLIAAAVGTPLGILAGYVKGAVGESLLRVGDIVLTFPVFVLALVVVTALGQGESNLVLVVGFVQAPIYLRLTYGISAALAGRGYVESARLSGAGRTRIILRHILPNASGPLFVQVSVTIGLSILLVSGLSYVGAGIQAPTPEWGSMIATGSQNLATGQWWTSVFPGIAIGLTVVGFAVLSERISRLFEPGSAGSEPNSFTSSQTPS
ncbi:MULTISPECIES: ABC transporter permease [unclassified Streptomyces]|uniref:ABC transporter permease n=1 Tax=unclassified Streptomyces TaxID=2593676 RepID=UPI002E28CBE3|nr:ABC transporter permease [Streptomyces sp. NBC_00223]